VKPLALSNTGRMARNVPAKRVEHLFAKQAVVADNEYVYHRVELPNDLVGHSAWANAVMDTYLPATG
jgi:hypothetical protein